MAEAVCTGLGLLCILMIVAAAAASLLVAFLLFAVAAEMVWNDLPGALVPSIRIDFPIACWVTFLLALGFSIWVRRR